MPLCLAFSALFLAQTAAQTAATPTSAPQTAAAAPQSLAQILQTPMTVAGPVRLALTPHIDGVIEPEEWDPLVSAPNLTGYFQWEPGKLHFAGLTPIGNDLLVSIDFGSNGWLVGADNIEVRLSISNGAVAYTIRQMDGTQVSGPRWINAPGMMLASKAAAQSDSVNTTYEFTLDDAGMGLCPLLPKSHISVRMDAIPTSTPPVDAYLPRVTAPLDLEYVRSAALPNGMQLRVENSGVYVPIGEGTKLRFAFNGNPKMNLQRLQLRGEGFARNLTELAVPFPPFDDKGRTFIDYPVQVPSDASLGFRIVRGTLVGNDGLSAVMEASLRISPPYDVVFVREPVRSKPQAQTVRLAYYIKSNSGKRLSGDTGVTVPTPLALTKPESDKFVVEGARSNVRIAFEVQIPGGTQGVFPIHVRVNAGGKDTDSIGYLNIH